MAKERDPFKAWFISLIWGGHVKIQAELSPRSSFTPKSVREALLFRKFNSDVKWLLSFSHQFHCYIIPPSASKHLQNTAPLAWLQVCDIWILICNWMNHTGVRFYCICITVKFVTEELHPASTWIREAIWHFKNGYSSFWEWICAV